MLRLASTDKGRENGALCGVQGINGQAREEVTEGGVLSNQKRVRVLRTCQEAKTVRRGRADGLSKDCTVYIRKAV